jgi:hypothetical protein
MMRTLLLVLAVPLVVVTGCGSSSAGGLRVGTATSVSAASSKSLAATSGGFVGVLPSATPRTTGGARSVGVQSTASPARGLGVTLGASCVVPGGTESLTVQSRPGYSVAFNTRYADGKGGDSYGGSGVLPTNQQGVARTTWVVTAAAPLGGAVVNVGTANGGTSAMMHASFTVSKQC